MFEGLVRWLAMESGRRQVAEWEAVFTQHRERAAPLTARLGEAVARERQLAAGHMVPPYLRRQASAPTERSRGQGKAPGAGVESHQALSPLLVAPEPFVEFERAAAMGRQQP